MKFTAGYLTVILPTWDRKMNNSPENSVLTFRVAVPLTRVASVWGTPPVAVSSLKMRTESSPR